MHATPEKWEETRGERFEREDADTEERYGPRPERELPPVDGCEELVAYLFEVGPAPGGEELTHTELRNWQYNTGIELEEFEVTTLKALSRTYLSMLHEARKPDCPWPAARELTDEEKIAKSVRMRKNRVKKGND